MMKQGKKELGINISIDMSLIYVLYIIVTLISTKDISATKYNTDIVLSMFSWALNGIKQFHDYVFGKTNVSISNSNIGGLNISWIRRYFQKIPLLTKMMGI